MEILIILAYAVILGLVAPYITSHNKEYGVLLPPAVAAVVGSALWIALTLTGFKYEEAWIWIIVMVAMPVVMVFAMSRLAAVRIKAREAAKKA